MKKKILFLVPLPPPYYGAAVSSKLCLESELLRKEFEIKHVKLNLAERFEDIGKLTLRKTLGFFCTNLKILSNLIFFRPNLVYFAIAPIGSGFLRDSFFVLLCKLFHKKIIFHLRGKGIKDEIKNSAKYFLYKTVFKNSRVIILDERLYEDIRTLVSREKIFILPNAIKNELTEDRFKSIINKRKKKIIPTILFLSNMEETKGPLILLEACKILRDEGIKFRCIFAGAWATNEFKEKFFDFILKNKLNDFVSYVGAVVGKEKRKVLENSDIFVFPTYYRLETFGLVILEAMEYGLPVVAHGVGAIPSIVEHGKTGFILKKNIPQELAAYLKFLIKNRKIAINMGKKGRRRFLNYYCFSEYEKKLKSILEIA